MDDPHDTTPAPEPPDDGQAARYAEVLARLQGLMPLVAEIAEVLRDVVPPRHGRRRRWPPGDRELFDALSALPADLTGDFETAIDRLKDTLETLRGAAMEAAREELGELEARARELRRKLGQRIIPAEDAP